MSALAIRDLRVTAGGRCLLRVPALDLAAGGLMAVRGPSGAGKTTLLNALAGLVAAQGRLCWGDTDLTALSDRARARFRRDQIGLIFQDFLLFDDLSARDNALVAQMYRRDGAALAARVDALFARLGLEPLAGRRASLLSGGERQRVAVARALAHDPAIILADEPTASLDRANADALIADLAGLARDGGRSVVIVSHDPSVWAEVDRVVSLRDGGLADG